VKYKVFGCKVNKYYSEKWLNSHYLSDKSWVFVASCVVTDSAKKKWIKFIKQEIPHLKDTEKIYISGCGAFENGKERTDFFSIYSDLSDFQDKIEILWENPDDMPEKKPEKTIDTSKIAPLTKLALTTKKFLLIQWGCDSFCTFCLTVVKRGRHFYRSKEDIVEEILEFEGRGGKEVVLTGVNLGAWWQNTTNDFSRPALHELLEYILEKTTIPRIRISSLGPEFVGENLLTLFSETRIYPHIHYSIQSGNSRILKLMRRHYDGDFMRDILQKTMNIQRSDGIKMSVGADLIVGFPTETEEEFRNTLELVELFWVTKLHAFPFSAHTLGEHVPASFFPGQIQESVKKERLHRLLQAGEKNRAAFITSQIGQEFEILLEKVSWDTFQWWTQNYIECTQENCKITTKNTKKNEIVRGILLGI